MGDDWREDSTSHTPSSCTRMIRRFPSKFPKSTRELSLQEQCSQRWQSQCHREWPAVSGNLLGHNPTAIAHVGACVVCAIAIQQFTPVSAVRHAHPIL